MIIRVKVDTRAALKMLWQLSNDLSPEKLYSLLTEEGTQSRKNVKEAIGVPYNRDQYHSTGKPRMRSGLLHDSIGYRIEKASRVKGISMVFGTVNAKPIVRLYSHVQELGFTFRAKGKLLAIPLTPALTDKGLLRFRPLEAQKFYPQGTFIKNRIIYAREGQSRVALFKLKTTNKVPGIPRERHEFIRPEAEDLFQRVYKRLEDMMQEAVRRAQG